MPSAIPAAASAAEAPLTSAVSAPAARSGVPPMFTSATAAEVTVPLSRPSTAATPTVAQSWARRRNLRYDQPAKVPSFGTRISVRSSPGPTAVSKTPRKKSAAGTTRSPPVPRTTISAPSASTTAGKV